MMMNKENEAMAMDVQAAKLKRAMALAAISSVLCFAAMIAKSLPMDMRDLMGFAGVAITIASFVTSGRPGRAFVLPLTLIRWAAVNTFFPVNIFLILLVFPPIIFFMYAFPVTIIYALQREYQKAQDRNRAGSGEHTENPQSAQRN